MKCPACDGEHAGFPSACLRRMRELERAEGQLEAVFRLKLWASTLSDGLHAELLRVLDDLGYELEKEHMTRQEWTLSDIEKRRKEIEVEILLKARNGTCPGCAKFSGGPHRCSALTIRKLIARVDPQGMSSVSPSPKEWMPKGTP